MRLLIVGATGRIGRALIVQARERDHDVTAFVRSPQKLGPLAQHMSVLQGDPHSIAELSAALPGHDAVISALPLSTSSITSLCRSLMLESQKNESLVKQLFQPCDASGRLF